MVFISVGDPDPVPYDRMFSGLPSPHPDPFIRGQNVTGSPTLVFIRFRHNPHFFPKMLKVDVFA
jgi:hypothetical protein